ncbi:MAG: ATP-binding protein [Candidatus Thorarchaeota archaeon]
MSLIISIFHNLNHESNGTLGITKIILVIALLTSTIFLGLNLPYFILNDSSLFLEMNFRVFLATILFNLSIILYFSSLIINLLICFQVDESAVILDKPSRILSKKGEILIGRILKGKVKKQKFYLSIKDLEKHMFICGATGTGKSNFLMNFLINFSKTFKIPFFLVEFKGEYHFLQRRIDNTLIYWPGENFSINIFNPGEVSPLIHAERVFDIIKSGKFIDENSEFSPQMEKVLVEILTKVCQSESTQNWKGFEHYCEIYLKENKNKIPMLGQTLISIKNRIRRYSIGPLKVLFENKDCIDIRKLFKQNILLDLSSIIRLGGEKEDALFFLNMILKYLWDENLSKGANQFIGIKHLIIIEDAQYFAPQNFIQKNKITSYLEDIALLQRGTGECLITLATRPDISKEILANNGIVMTFKNHLDKDVMCELLNLDIEKRNYLSILEEGQCIIRVNSVKEPFLLKVPLVNGETLSVKEIFERNNQILDRMKGGTPSETALKIKFQKSLLYKLIRKINITSRKKKNKDLNDIVNSYLNESTKPSFSKIPSANFWEPNGEERSFKNLKEYILKLDLMQKEKE